MALFGLPLFSFNNLVYRGFEWASDTVSTYTPNFLELIGIKQAEASPLLEQAVAPEQPRLFGEFTTMTSEQMDARYDQRQPAIDALLQRAKEQGIELPKTFVDSIYNCNDPTWTRHADGLSNISIFDANGNISPEVQESILKNAKSGDLETQAAERFRAGLDRVSVYAEDRREMLDTLEQREGVKIDAEVRAELDKTGVYVYKNAEGHRREINADSPNAAALMTEMAELKKNFMPGAQGAEVNIQDVAVQHAQAVHQAQEAIKGRA